jgi:hypothetical protein
MDIEGIDSEEARPAIYGRQEGSQDFEDQPDSIRCCHSSGWVSW